MAVGFRARKANGTYRYFWLYRVKFAVPSTNLTTKGDSIEFSTPTIEGTVTRRNKLDGKNEHPWKAEVNEDDTAVEASVISEIAKRYGGLENLGTKLMKSENFEMALDEIIWLIALMANQSILIYNLRHKDEPKPLLTEEEVELLTSPLELATYKDAIMEAMFRGTKRNVESEADPKNVPVG